MTAAARQALRERAERTVSEPAWMALQSRDVLALLDALDEAERLLNAVAPHICGLCGPHARVDEDLCCAVCGCTTFLAGETYGRAEAEEAGAGAREGEW